MSSLLKPASRVDVRGVGIDPEVMALGIPIEVQTQTVATHLAHEGHHGTPMPANALSLSLTSPGLACVLGAVEPAGSHAAFLPHAELCPEPSHEDNSGAREP